MFGIRKIVPGLGYKDLKKTFRPSMRSGYIGDFSKKVVGETGNKIFAAGDKGRAAKKELYDALREDSKSRGLGEKGFTKNNLTKFYAKMLNNKKDSFTDRKILKLISISGLKRNKVRDYAFEMQREQNNAKVEQKMLE